MPHLPESKVPNHFNLNKKEPNLKIQRLARPRYFWDNWDWVKNLTIPKKRLGTVRYSAPTRYYSLLYL